LPNFKLQHLTSSTSNPSFSNLVLGSNLSFLLFLLATQNIMILVDYQSLSYIPTQSFPLPTNPNFFELLFDEEE
jgi:hypothetical protein